jgi:hypothetical protein
MFKVNKNYSTNPNSNDRNAENTSVGLPYSLITPPNPLG